MALGKFTLEPEMLAEVTGFTLNRAARELEQKRRVSSHTSEALP